MKEISELATKFLHYKGIKKKQNYIKRAHTMERERERGRERERERLNLKC